MAEASVQPVPWVCRLAMRWPGNRIASDPSNSRSTGLPGQVPALDQDPAGPERAERLGGPPHPGLVGDLGAGQQPGLQQVRGQHRRQRQQVGP